MSRPSPGICPWICGFFCSASAPCSSSHIRGNPPKRSSPSGPISTGMPPKTTLRSVLILFGNYMALQHARMNEGDLDTDSPEVAMFSYLALRVVHWCLYAGEVRQPYRAISFIASNAAMAAMLRNAVGRFLSV
mmetsp:Transcript_11778/g.29575  ORF Transcript_11778/g.29575 Transcript_11778/m.29575 type:complete len:133 (-) Transcript_11778:147-545(-)